MSDSSIPWTEAPQASLSFTISWSLLKLMFTELVMPSNHLILYHPPFPPVFNFSQHQGLFQWVGSSHQVAKVISIYSNKPLWWQVCVCVCVFSHCVPCSIPGGSVEQCLVHRRTSINICWISEWRRYLSLKCLFKIQSTF